jgi:hypothetical protein
VSDALQNTGIYFKQPQPGPQANTTLIVASGSIVQFEVGGLLQNSNGVNIPLLPGSQFVTSAVSNGTASAGDITGAESNYLTLTAAGANAYTLRTATQVFGDIPNAQVGQAFSVRIINTGSGTVTVTTAAGWTLNGTMTIATNSWRDFVLTLNSATTATLQSVGTGTMS